MERITELSPTPGFGVREETLKKEELMLVDDDVEEDSDEEEGMEHPLINSIVANTLMSYLPVQDLKTCRLVCRQWDEEARLHLSRKVKAVLHSEEKMKEYNWTFVLDKGFFDTVQLGPYMYMGNETTDRFFNIYGLYIKHLILHKTQCSAVHMREILFRWAPNLEELTLVGMTPGKSRFLEDLHVYEKFNLHNLKILNVNLMMTQGEDLLRDFLFDLFSVTPNLKKITVPRNNYKGFLTSLLATLMDSPELPLENLTQIDTLFSFGDGQIERLTARKFPLQSLNMQLMPNVTVETLVSLLDSLSPTLKSLRLHFYLTRFKELPNLVHLAHLENLTLDVYQGSLKFISSLPELEQLQVCMKCFDDLEDSMPKTDHGPGFWSCPTLKAFHAHLSVVEGCPSGIVTTFESVFPGLRVLTLPGITDIALKLLCSAFPKLEELNAIHGVYTDMGITGFAEGKLRYLSRSVNIADLENLRHGCNDIPPHSGNLLSFTRLRKLQLQSPDLTDDSIFFAIMHLKELRELSFERSDITDRGIDALTNLVGLQQLSISLCTRVSGPQLEVLKATMKNRNLVFIFDGVQYV